MNIGKKKSVQQLIESISIQHIPVIRNMIYIVTARRDKNIPRKKFKKISPSSIK